MDIVASNIATVASSTSGRRMVYLWWDRLAEKLGIRVEILGAILALITIAGTWLIPQVVSPEIIAQSGFGDRFYLLALNIMLAFISIPYGIRRSQEDFDQLSPHIYLDAEQLALERQQLAMFSRRGMWISGVLGLLVAAVLEELLADRWSRALTLDWSWVDFWMMPQVVFGLLFTYQGSYVVLAMGAGMWRVGGKLVTPRLFDTEIGQVLCRFGLRIVWIILICPALAIGMILLGNPESLRATFVTFIPVILIGLVCLLVPTAGYRNQVRKLKQEELGRIGSGIHGDNAALETSPLAARVCDLSLTELLTYRQEVEKMREWPIDLAVMTRFVGYIGLPVGSVVAASYVRVLVEDGVN
jgi:hypothetical protein